MTMLVQEVMSRTLVTLSSEQTLRDAMNLFRSNRIRHLPVVADGKLIGIVTDRDVKRATPSLLSGVTSDEFDHVLDTTAVAQVMTRDPITASPDDPLKSVVKIFLERKVGALPVVSEGVLAGILTEIDLLRVLHELLPD
jgi:acetoin utilization protein AcuB